MTLDKLYNIILDRRKSMPKNSYVASLFREGSDAIIQKVGEEAVEVIIAAKNKNKKEIISETADLLFHLLVLLVKYDIKVDDVWKKLEKRQK